jgi:hypothetical protein
MIPSRFADRLAVIGWIVAEARSEAAVPVPA